MDEDLSSEHAARLKPAAATTPMTAKRLNPDTWRWAVGMDLCPPWKT
ncbi:hypothetical protein ckrop_1769 [Corynebacterium kroppenstedtii DSM 44385]|uniref:Uncharacterized protein n=1 Tax=Corynebacterium kroppenstedtii (strain DSM 44385 / JCM 11950 / CIP 105744 / CCUG 35717) TaxID=645127 RepID=C4LKY5_CORK4|nr:hypothetical protein ckrop_1769 [Corynebacterium kroppenstedtii DSM 44385]